jgi:glycosyl hydrolase, family 88
MKYRFFIAFMLLLGVCAQAQTWTAGDVEAIIEKVNDTWQAAHPQHERAFWDNAVYHTGNMAAYALLQKRAWAEYSEAWAKHNLWQGARETNPAKWKYKNYGEGQDYVLFGDWQICFQTYIDLYNLQPDPNKIARAKEVMAYEAASDVDDYWWWADALYMVMPVMTKMYKLTGDIRYLDKMYDNWKYANKIMYDKTTGLYFRDGKYVFPAHKSVNGKKDFWSRGDGWVMAAFAKVLADLPQNASHRSEYIRYYRKMAKAVAQCQQKEGYWTRSLLDPEHAPGPESSGTSLFTFALFYGINNGYLSAKKYLSVAERAWNYLATTALQPDGTVGYMQPIGEKAIPGQVVGRTSVTNFGTGAFLLAACEYARYQRARQR